MKAFLRHVTTGKFLTLKGDWTDDLSVAKVFDSGFDDMNIDHSRVLEWLYLNPPAATRLDHAKSTLSRAYTVTSDELACSDL